MAPSLFLSKEVQYPSFYNDFKDDRIEPIEIFETLGRIEYPLPIFPDNRIEENQVFDIALNLCCLNSNGKEFEKNILSKNFFFRSVRVFWTLLLYVYSVNFKKRENSNK